MGQGTLSEVPEGSRTLPEVPYGLGDSPEYPRRVIGPSRRSGTGRVILPKVWVGSGNPPKGQIGAPYLRSLTVLGTLPKVRN